MSLELKFHSDEKKIHCQEIFLEAVTSKIKLLADLVSSKRTLSG